MKCHFAYYAIFIVALSGSTIGAPKTEIPKTGLFRFSYATKDSDRIFDSEAAVLLSSRGIAFYDNYKEAGEKSSKPSIYIKRDRNIIRSKSHFVDRVELNYISSFGDWSTIAVYFEDKDESLKFFNAI